MSKALFLMEFLNQHESAPSAYVLARSFATNSSIPDDEVDLIYERSEGVNDSERNQLISQMSDSQLIEFYEFAMEILLEKITDLENHYLVSGDK